MSYEFKDVPKDGMLVIKTDCLDYEQMNTLKEGLKNKHGFTGSIICFPIESDLYFLSECKVSEAFKELIEKVNSLEAKVKELTEKNDRKAKVD